MILDALLQFSNAQSVAAVVSTINSTNDIDLGMGQVGNQQIPTFAAGGGARDIGIGDDPALKLLVLITTTVTSGGAATLQVGLQGAPDSGTGTEGAFTTWWTSPAYALATLIAGARLFDMDMPRPPAGIAIPRFLRLIYIIGGATTTAGNVSSYIVLDRHDIPEQSNAVLGGYPAGINIAN
jgi:hypothetical protein